jgi:hypothetical protein
MEHEMPSKGPEPIVAVPDPAEFAPGPSPVWVSEGTMHELRTHGKAGDPRTGRVLTLLADRAYNLDEFPDHPEGGK